MPRILLSAAHTLQAPGEVYQDLREADLTRKILKMCVPHLEKSKIEFKTVPLDLHLLDRIDWINDTGYTEEQGDIFVEIHVNDGGKRGIEGWYNDNPGPDNNAQALAEFMVNELCTITKFEKQGAKSEYEHELTQLLILRQTKPIATALELLYIDNVEDIKILKDDKKLDELAKNLVKTAVKFAKLPKDKLDEIKKKQQEKDLSANVKGGMFGGGGFGGGTTPPFGGGTNPLGGNSSTGNSGSSNIVMDRDERKKMIKRIYKKGLGKEPNESDINFFLNQGVSEDQMIRRVFESKDHTQMVEDYKEFKKLKEGKAQLEAQVTQLTSGAQDKNRMMHNLQNLLQHKNGLIARLKQEMVNRGVMQPGEFMDHNAPPPQQYLPQR